uniref:Aminotransferase-like plant mobile domain-containing protein n=1 Tax=Leersia perrieri TaxID=77586 RepID=A0A0D9XY92_9ORYZ
MSAAAAQEEIPLVAESTAADASRFLLPRAGAGAVLPPPPCPAAALPIDGGGVRVDFHGWPSTPRMWGRWVEKLRPRHEQAWRKLGILDEMGILATVDGAGRVRRDEWLLLGLTAFWSAATSSFVFPWGEATVTLEDVAVLAGLPVVGNFPVSEDVPGEFAADVSALEVVRQGVAFVRALPPRLRARRQGRMHRAIPVARQLGFDQDVPGFVARANSSSSLAWATYEMKAHGVKFVVPCNEPGGVTVEYKQWWECYSPAFAVGVADSGKLKRLPVVDGRSKRKGRRFLHGSVSKDRHGEASDHGEEAPSRLVDGSTNAGSSVAIDPAASIPKKLVPKNFVVISDVEFDEVPSGKESRLDAAHVTSHQTEASKDDFKELEMRMKKLGITENDVQRNPQLMELMKQSWMMMSSDDESDDEEDEVGVMHLKSHNLEETSTPLRETNEQHKPVENKGNKGDSSSILVNENAEGVKKAVSTKTLYYLRPFALVEDAHDREAKGENADQGGSHPRREVGTKVMIKKACEARQAENIEMESEIARLKREIAELKVKASVSKPPRT